MRPVLKCDPAKSRVQQHFKHECNINAIVAKSRLHGSLPAPKGNGFFGDFSGMDFTSMQNAVCQAKEAFMLLPAKLRSRFANSPQNLIDFVSDESNREEAILIGLIPKPEKKPPENAANAASAQSPT